MIRGRAFTPSLEHGNESNEEERYRNYGEKLEHGDSSSEMRTSEASCTIAAWVRSDTHHARVLPDKGSSLLADNGS